MEITITRNALRALLFGMLSCHCPVTKEVEIELFCALQDRMDTDLELEPFVTIADRNPVRTPLHIFLEYCRYGHDDPNRFSIGLEDVIRYFCSRFHYAAAKAALDPVTIPDPASQLVGHMMLVTEYCRDETWNASVSDNVFKLDNLFVPAQINIKADGLYGVHFGMILCELTPQQATIVHDHLTLIPELSTLASRLEVIDYADYQTFGDHSRKIAGRYERNF